MRITRGQMCVLPAGAHRFGQHHTCGVHSLKDALQIDPSCDLPDEYRSHSFRAKFLMHTQKVNLHHLLLSGGIKEQIWVK